MPFFGLPQSGWDTGGTSKTPEKPRFLRAGDCGKCSKLWYYRNVAVDPVTGKKTAQVQLVFEGGVVTSVNFN